MNNLQKNIINVSHIVICLAFQAAMYLLTKNLFVGALVGTFFFAGREIAQAEYRNIEASPTKQRKDMHVLGGLNIKFWTMKSLIADLLVPSAIAFGIALLF